MRSVGVKFLMAVLLALLASGNAMADRHGRVSIWFGYPGPWLFPPPIYYPPTVVVTPAPTPPVYVEQADTAADTSDYWYYCVSSKTYYPYVKECPEGWQRVSPRPKD